MVNLEGGSGAVPRGFISFLRRMTIALLSLLGLVGVALAWWWTHPPDAERDVRARYRPLETLERSPVISFVTFRLRSS